MTERHVQGFPKKMLDLPSTINSSISLDWVGGLVAFLGVSAKLVEDVDDDAGQVASTKQHASKLPQV